MTDSTIQVESRSTSDGTDPICAYCPQSPSRFPSGGIRRKVQSDQGRGPRASQLLRSAATPVCDGARIPGVSPWAGLATRRKLPVESPFGTRLLAGDGGESSTPRRICHLPGRTAPQTDSTVRSFSARWWSTPICCEGNWRTNGSMIEAPSPIWVESGRTPDRSCGSPSRPGHRAP